MTDTTPATPADELRAAASLLRVAASHATPGPWRTHDTWVDRGGHTATVLTDRPDINDTELVAWLPTMSNQPWDEARNAWRNAGWMALMSPSVGLAVADWLEASGLLLAAMPPSFNHDHALRVARLVLGTTDQQPETAPDDRYRTAWHSARNRAAVLSAEITRRAPLLGEYAAEIERLRAERTELIRQRDQIAMDTIKALPAPVDRSAVLNEAADLLTEIGTPIFGNRSEHERGLMYGAERLRRLADEAQQPEPVNAEENPDDAARRFARRLHAVEQLCSGRPGYHTVTVKALLTAMSDADDEAQQPETEAAPWPSTTEYTVEIREADVWVGVTFHCLTLTEARERRDAHRHRSPNTRFRIVRWDETATVVETDPEPCATADALAQTQQSTT
ncbi:hypothetical protein [Streptomyces sp. NPDC059651]|uniref:hypothetical protein n=1 Tax=Streptomyces sp. NPDC059651 TaxID=3346897 RepID=UPI00368E983C